MTSTLTEPKAAKAAKSSKPVIVLRNIRKTYMMGHVAVEVLRGISMTIDPGDFAAIMGASGSGKSTTMHIIGCLDVPSRGYYWLDGIDVRSLTDEDLSKIRNRKIGFVFQSFNLIPRLSVLANVELPLTYQGVKKQERRERAVAALSATGMSHRLIHMPTELSGGEQQRVAVARAVVTNPSILLADEPTGNLPSHQSAEVMNIFSQLNAEGRTVILVTHEEDIAEHAKRIIRIQDGMVVRDTRSLPVDALPPRLDASSKKTASRPISARLADGSSPPHGLLLNTDTPSESISRDSK